MTTAMSNSQNTVESSIRVILSAESCLTGFVFDCAEKEVGAIASVSVERLPDLWCSGEMTVTGGTDLASELTAEFTVHR